MDIKTGSIVKLKGEETLWHVSSVRGEDKKEHSFKEFVLYEAGDHLGRRAIVRAEVISEVL